VEGVDTGITFEATAGGFGFVAVSVDDKLINKQNTHYTFTMRPQDVFDSKAILKIACPTQITVSQGAGVQGGTAGLVVPSASRVDVKFDRVIYVYNAFPNGMATIQTFDITLNGFTNPATTQTTDSFHVSIFYEEGVSEVSVYRGNQLTISATPSTALTIEAVMSEKLTGQVQSSFVIKGVMEEHNPIEKQASLRIKIPGSFLISNYDRVASTCTRLTGFSDEITCSFEKVADPRFDGNIMIVKGGFDSETFTGREFSLKIAEIKNPFTTQPTESF